MFLNPIVLFIGYSVILAILAVVAIRLRRFRLRRALLQIVLVLALLGILVFIEMFSFFKIYKRWDLTENQRYTFSSMTVNLLKSLDEPLVATAFVQIDRNKNRCEHLLSNAHYYNQSFFSYDFADPARDLVKASKFPQPVEPPVVFLEYKGKTERFSNFTEEAFTQALSKLIKTEKRTIYLLEGHDERALDPGESKAGASLKNLRDLLEGQNKNLLPFKIDPKTLSIPSDCDVLLVAGPQVDFSTGEYSALDRYLVEGGKMVVMLDNARAPGVAQWLEQFGLVLPDDMIIEMEQSLAMTSEGIQPQITLNLAASMIPRENEIGTDLIDRHIFAIEARSVGLASEMPAGVTGEILVDSAENAWAELHPDYDNLESAQLDEGIEQEGPVPMAAMVSGNFSAALGISSATDAPQGTLIVFGDSNFPTDRTYGRSYGINLLNNTINFLTRDTEMISIPPKTEQDAPLVRMTASLWGQLLLASMVFLPGVMLVIGLGVYIRRRKNG